MSRLSAQLIDDLISQLKKKNILNNMEILYSKFCSIIKPLCLWIFIGFIPFISFAQECFTIKPDNLGKEFFIMFNNHYSGEDLYVVISSTENCTGYIEYLNVQIPFAVTANQKTQIQVPSSLINRSYLFGFGNVSNNGIYINATKNVHVVGVNSVLAGSIEGFNAIPLNGLGTKYFALSYTGGAEFGIVGTADNTVVRIIINGQSTQYIINRLQTIQYSSIDVSGIEIVSNKPISLFSGNPLILIPSNYRAGDHIVEQIPPIVSWGKNFKCAPNETSKNFKDQYQENLAELLSNKRGDIFRVISSSDNTTVTLKNNIVQTINLNKGQLYEFSSSVYTEISSNNPIMVAQFGGGSSYYFNESPWYYPINDGLIDPFMVILQPTEYLKKEYNVFTYFNLNNLGSNTSTKNDVAPENYLSFIIPSVGYSSLKINDQILSNPILYYPNSDVIYGNVLVDEGFNKVTSDYPFYLTTYGYGYFEALGYNGGQYYNIEVPFSITPKYQSLRTNKQACISISANLPASLDKNKNYCLSVGININGTNTINDNVILDQDGNGSFCYNSINEGNDIISATFNNLTENATVNWIGDSFTCSECIPSFSPVPGQKYVIGGWVREGGLPATVTSFRNPGLQLTFRTTDPANYEAIVLPVITASGAIIEGWQRVEGTFVVPDAATGVNVRLVNAGSGDVYFDDIRIHPFNANMKSFVYDPETYRLSAELDENNYATFYEYDEEGKLVRVKKETAKGIKTIRESRDNVKKTTPTP